MLGTYRDAVCRAARQNNLEMVSRTEILADESKPQIDFRQTQFQVIFARGKHINR